MRPGSKPPAQQPREGRTTGNRALDPGDVLLLQEGTGRVAITNEGRLRPPREFRVSLAELADYVLAQLPEVVETATPVSLYWQEVTGLAAGFDNVRTTFTRMLDFSPDLSAGVPFVVLQQGVGSLRRMDVAPASFGELRLTGGDLTGVEFGRAPRPEDVFFFLYAKGASAPTVTYPTYHAPTITVSSSLSVFREEGETITTTLSVAWDQADAGAATAFRLKKDGVVIASGSTAASISGSYTFAVSGFVDITAEADYADGPQLYDSLGFPYGTPIAAGTAVSPALEFTGVRKAFFDADTATIPVASSSDVRALGSSILGVANGSVFTVTIGATARRVTIAYPATLRAVTSIQQVELFNFDVKDAFDYSEVSVNDASGGNPVTYRVYTFIADVEFGVETHYTVTI